MSRITRVRAAFSAGGRYLVQQVDRSDLQFLCGVALLAWGLAEVYAPAAAIAAGVLFIWASLPPAPPTAGPAAKGRR